MGEFSKHYKGQDLIALNVFHMYKQVVHTSCIVLCNSRTIDRERLTMTPGHSDGHKFPLQHPTTSDWTLWKNALKKISSQYYTFSRQLGDFVSSPHRPKSGRPHMMGTSSIILRLSMMKTSTSSMSNPRNTPAGHRPDPE